jgi:hypothetical protein
MALGTYAQRELAEERTASRDRDAPRARADDARERRHQVRDVTTPSAATASTAKSTTTSGRRTSPMSWSANGTPDADHSSIAVDFTRELIAHPDQSASLLDRKTSV